MDCGQKNLQWTFSLWQIFLIALNGNCLNFYPTKIDMNLLNFSDDRQRVFKNLTRFINLVKFASFVLLTYNSHEVTRFLYSLYIEHSFCIHHTGFCRGEYKKSPTSCGLMWSKTLELKLYYSSLLKLVESSNNDQY